MDHGLGPVRPADAAVKGYCEDVKAAIRQKVRKNFEMFLALQYRSQADEETTFFVKIQTTKADGGCVHARICQQPQEGAVSLVAIETGKQIDDPIEYF